MWSSSALKGHFQRVVPGQGGDAEGKVTKKQKKKERKKERKGNDVEKGRRDAGAVAESSGMGMKGGGA